MSVSQDGGRVTKYSGALKAPIDEAENRELPIPSVGHVPRYKQHSICPFYNVQDLGITCRR